jgi:hypothetical protein
VSPNEITATVPAFAEAGRYEIVVTTPLGTSHQPLLSPRIDIFDVNPVVTGISPNHGPATGQTEVTITGSCFDYPDLDSSTFVKAFFGDREAGKDNNQCQSATQCVVGNPPVPNVGQADVTVEVSGARSAATPQALFTYTGLVINGLNPNHGPKTGGTSVAVEGEGFPPSKENNEDVTFTFLFGSASANGDCIFGIISAPSGCETVTPQVATAGPVQVTGMAFGATNPTTPGSIFTFDEFPALTKFTPPAPFVDEPAMVSLNGRAPAGGAAVSITSSDSTVARSEQPTVTIPAGSSAAKVPLIMPPSPVVKQATLTATYEGSSASTTISVPAAPPLAMIAPDELGVNKTTSVQVWLNIPAPAGGATVALSSSDTAKIAVPASLSFTIPAGDYTGTFPITNLYSGRPKRVTLSATYKGASASSDIWVPLTLPVCRPKQCPPGSFWNPDECACLRQRPE